jgi:hypothetical protein
MTVMWSRRLGFSPGGDGGVVGWGTCREPKRSPRLRSKVFWRSWGGMLAVDLDRFHKHGALPPRCDLIARQSGLRSWNRRITDHDQRFACRQVRVRAKLKDEWRRSQTERFRSDSRIRLPQTRDDRVHQRKIAPIE